MLLSWSTHTNLRLDPSSPSQIPISKIKKINCFRYNHGFIIIIIFFDLGWYNHELVKYLDKKIILMCMYKLNLFVTKYYIYLCVVQYIKAKRIYNRRQREVLRKTTPGKAKDNSKISWFFHIHFIRGNTTVNGSLYFPNYNTKLRYKFFFSLIFVFWYFILVSDLVKGCAKHEI